MSAEIHLHTPPDQQLIPRQAELVFLAGPIQGAPDWQSKAAMLIADSVHGLDKVHIANPRRDVPKEDFDYKEQVRWERKHLLRAFTGGVALFWLQAQDPDLPYKIGRPYAQTTRFEFGMAYAAHPQRFAREFTVLGMHPNYKGSEKYYRDVADELNLPVYDTLEATCQAAALLISKFGPDEAA